MSLIPRAEYLENPSIHNQYWLQFATQDTEAFIARRIGMDRLLKSKDKYFNDIGIKHSNNGAGPLVWDYAPINVVLLEQAGDCCSLSAITCVAKACARAMVNRIHEGS